MKYIDKAKISGIMKKVAGSILAIDSSELRNKKERLHALHIHPMKHLDEK